jgi:hypothetical protein
MNNKLLKIWGNSVWSKVIAWFITLLFSTICTLIYAKSKEIDFIDACKRIIFLKIEIWKAACIIISIIL